MKNTTTSAEQILTLLMRFQRHGRDCTNHPCEKCMAVHQTTIESFIIRGQPIVCVLPGFPGKSPNCRDKVLGILPDMAEEIALTFLNSLAEQIREIHPPGARIIIASDGHVFSDLVRISDENITAYRTVLWEMIGHQKNLSLFTLEDVDTFEAADFTMLRKQLMQLHGESLEAIRKEIHENADSLKFYCGISRFLLEDATGVETGLTRNALQKECRQRAYGVIARSRAWGDLLAKQFPEALRLSIHPQPCGAQKLGIHLLETADNWLTPWHGVALKKNGKFMLVKRKEAEVLEATLVFKDGRASHYVCDST